MDNKTNEESIRTYWFIGSNGQRHYSQGNGMHNPAKPSPEFDRFQAAEDAAVKLNEYLPKDKHLSVYRCEVYLDS